MGTQAGCSANHLDGPDPVDLETDAGVLNVLKKFTPDPEPSRVHRQTLRLRGAATIRVTAPAVKAGSLPCNVGRLALDGGRNAREVCTP